jgi:hypothetical protein
MSLGSWADAALHQYYTEVQELHTLVGRASPLLDRLRKSMVEGATTNMFFTLAGGMGVAGDLVSAQEVASQVGTNGAGTAPGAATFDGEWQLPTGQIETSLRLKYKDLVQGKTNRGAYLRQLTHQTDRHAEYFGERFAQIILGSGGYRLGLFDLTNMGTGVITCLDSAGNVDASSIANIHKGMVLVASANDGTSLSHTLLPSNIAAQRAYVLSVDRDAGTFVVSDTAGSTTPEIPAGWGTVGADVSIFPVGQFKPTLPGSTLSNKLLCQTLGDWITPTVATDTFGTVDRSHDSALSGVRVPSASVASLPIDHKIGFAATYLQSRYAGRNAPTFVLQSERWFELVRSLQAQGIVKDIGSILEGGAKSVRIATVNGMAEVIAEPHQDPTFAYGLQLDEINIRHLDGLPGVANADGLEMLRQADSNDLEFRLIAFPQLLIREPWLHCRMAL